LVDFGGRLFSRFLSCNVALIMKNESRVAERVPIAFQVFAPNFPTWQKTNMCRFFSVRDNEHIPYLFRFEYENSVKARKAT
jgi:hypothetical protein